MAFDTPTRNRLARLVTECRDLLTTEFNDKLQEFYGIYPDEGRVLVLEKLAHLDDERLRVAGLLRERIDHIVATDAAGGLAGAVKRILREQAFTVLNRFAALRMAEERGIIVESVGGGLNSKAFKTFSEVAFSGLGDAYQRYRVFLNLMFDELARDLGSLFDRSSPYGLLFPREDVLLKIFEKLNASDLKSLWCEDETIGWIYQYYNDPAERKKMRDESPAPRNSRELAVRNQFFTPRYVVEFLTDNTLGRLWYEMRRGETVLRESCRYFVRRPVEVFLNPGESAPEPAGSIETQAEKTLSQEELLRKPVHIPHRPLKDPREIRLLDPACGSMHFGLYAFDLFTVIYDEAWEIAHGTDEAARSAKAFAHFITFASSFADKAAFLREVPRLIVEHNIHGIDIDPRAAQIAGLSLWLRAQRAWHQAGVKPADRLRITRSNLVCAEPMPGEKELLREFVEQQFPVSERPAFAFLLEKIFDRMTLAGEAGSLLRIEEEIRAAIAEARALAQSQSAPRQTRLWAGDERPEQAEFDLRGLNDEQFWQKAEQRIYDALEAYAEQVENGGGFQRRLFANDTAQGFAFIDLCRKRYDVAVMNPPFGDASLPSKSYIDETYGDTKGDVYKAFVECFHARLHPASYLGIISSRTGFFLGQSEDWRTRVVLRLFRPIVLADLGSGVLDAMVEVAAYVLRSLSVPEARALTLALVPVLEKVERDRQDRFSLPKWQAARAGLKRHQAVAELEHLEAHGFIQRSFSDIVRYTSLWHSSKKVIAPPEPFFSPLVCIRTLGEPDKERLISRATNGESNQNIFVCNPASFFRIPGTTFAYWVGESVLRTFRRLPLIESGPRHALGGIKTLDDTRFLRTWWEPPSAADVHSKWPPMVKGGAKFSFYGPVPLVVDWRNKGLDISWYGYQRRPREGFGAASRGVEAYFRPGVTWSRRTEGLRFRILPAGCIFSDKGPAIVVAGDDSRLLLQLAGILNSSAFSGLVGLQLARAELAQSFEVGLIQTTPIPELENASAHRLGNLVAKIWSVMHARDATESTSHPFSVPSILAVSGSTLAERAAAWTARVRTSEETVAAIQAEIDDLAFRLYGLDAADRAALTGILATEVTGDDGADEDMEEQATTADTTALVADLLGYVFGIVFGRWDIRYATGARLAPKLPDPFAPLPVCPPGMLQGDDGLPLSPEAGRQEGRYPLDVAWDGILVDDSEHPLDLECRVHAALAMLWGDRADALEHEACTLLGVPTLREWFSRQSGFFADHLKRYSKSRRQAPIYWPLSTPSGSYTLWIYYHRLTDQTLFQCVNDFVKPKIAAVEGDLARVMSSTDDERTKRSEAERLTVFRSELVDFQKELLRVAQLPYKPNLNDGVLITASPLWTLFRLPKWQKALKECWESLASGKYDWAHLALSIWPDRVKKACERDRSIAIAHMLENLHKGTPPPAKRRRAKP